MARSFNGSSDGAWTSGFGPTGTEFTVACWFKLSSLGVANPLVARWTGVAAPAGFQFLLEVDGNNHLAGVTMEYPSAYAVPTGTTSLGAGVWYHGAFLKSAINAHQIYVNGVADGSADTTSVTTANAVFSDTTIGERGSYNGTGIEYFAAATIADATIWSVGLSLDEIAALARGVSPTRVRPLSILSRWRLSGAGSPEPDDSGQGHPLTLIGTSAADHAPVMAPFGADEWVRYAVAAPSGRLIYPNPLDGLGGMLRGAA